MNRQRKDINAALKAWRDRRWMKRRVKLQSTEIWTECTRNISKLLRVREELDRER